MTSRSHNDAKLLLESRNPNDFEAILPRNNNLNAFALPLHINTLASNTLNRGLNDSSLDSSSIIDNYNEVLVSNIRNPPMKNLAAGVRPSIFALSRSK